MTSCFPNSLATLLYEPISKPFIASIATPNSVLEEIGISFPSFLKLIERANITRLYNDYPITVFIPQNYIFDSNVNINVAFDFCKMLTIRKRINFETLTSSPMLVLFTESPENSLIIQTDGQNVTVNGLKIINTISKTNGIIYVLE